MKTTTILIAAVLTLSSLPLFASSDIPPYPSHKTAIHSSEILLAPSTPAEATFEEETMIMDYSAFTPTAPREATFEDDMIESARMELLAPSTPAEADFTEDSLETTQDYSAFAPKTPAEADFE